MHYGIAFSGSNAALKMWSILEECLDFGADPPSRASGLIAFVILMKLHSASCQSPVAWQVV